MSELIRYTINIDGKSMITDPNGNWCELYDAQAEIKEQTYRAAESNRQYNVLLFANKDLKAKNTELEEKVKLLEDCRRYDATGKNRPDGYIVCGSETAKRIDELNT